MYLNLLRKRTVQFVNDVLYNIDKPAHCFEKKRAEGLRPAAEECIVTLNFYAIGESILQPQMNRLI